MKKFKNAGKTLTVCMLIIALAVTFFACGNPKAEQPDLPYGLKFGQSYDEVVKVFEDKGVKFYEREIKEAEKDPQLDTYYARSCLEIAPDHSKPQDYKKESVKVDFQFLHSQKLSENFQKSDYDIYSQKFYFTDENKLYYFSCSPPGLPVVEGEGEGGFYSEVDLEETVLYYSDLFRKDITRYPIDLGNGGEMLVWENEKYFVNITTLGESPDNYIIGISIGLQME